MKNQFWGKKNHSKNKLAQKEERESIELGNDSVSSSDDSSNIETIHNRIYFYSEVERNSVLELNKEIRQLDDFIISQSLEWSHSPGSISIFLYINSLGGSVFDAFSAIDYIRNTRSMLISVIDGCAASAATLISISAKRRLINKHAYMLIHQMSSGFWGKYEELKDNMKNCDILMNRIRNIYKQYTNIPPKQLKEILKHDLWFDAKTCLKYGLVDEIIS